MTQTVTDVTGASFDQRSWRALGTSVFLTTTLNRLDEAHQVAHDLLTRVDLTCSRFRTDSDLVRANAGAGQWTKVDPLLVQAVTAALAAADLTDGLVDPCLGKALEQAGYDRDFSQLDRPGPSAAPARRDDPAAIPAPVVPQAWRWVEVDEDGGLRVPAGVALDLGATGKAFASDLVADELAARGIAAIVSVGGDISIANPQDADESVDWPVTVAERPDDEPVQTVYVQWGGVATSTVTHRRWQHQGVVLHHLLDPRTGRPVDPFWRTATVTAASCVQANTGSTVSIVLGETAVDWLREHGLCARLVRHDGEVVAVGGWPMEEA